MTTSRFDDLLHRVRACSVCAEHLPHGPRPVLQAHPSARLLIAGQAPGRKVHASGVPFVAASGERLATVDLGRNPRGFGAFIGAPSPSGP